jgi:hypothetical protein
MEFKLQEMGSSMVESIGAETFEVLSKGIVVSLNSDRYFEIANFLNIDENFEIFDDIISAIGYQLIGENGYFYLSKNRRLDSGEMDSFISTHKKTIIAISILKEIYPLISAGDVISFVEFVKDMHTKESDLIQQKMHFLFDNLDEKSAGEEFFKLLERNFVIERINSKDKNSYKVLNSIGYFVNIVESI